MLGFRSTCALAICALGMSACGDERSGTPKDDEEQTTGDAVLDALIGLGVPTSAGARVDGSGNDLPEDYSPFGRTATLNKTDELFVLGVRVQDTSGTTTSTFVETELGDIAVLESADTEPVWATSPQSSRSLAQSTRDAVAADVDGDGLEELVVIYVDRDDPGHDQELTAVIHQDSEAATPFGASSAVIAIEPNIVDVRIAAGDFDGDGDDDIVIGIAKGASAKLMFGISDGTRLAINGSATLPFGAGSGGVLHFALATGQLDYDPAEELAVVLNEFLPGATDSGITHWWAHDDALHAYAELGDGPVQANVGGTHTAVVADVALGDIDGDTLDEIILGGLTEYLGNSCDSYSMLTVAIDDAVHHLDDYGADWVQEFVNDCPAYSPFQVRWIHVGAADIDGDGAAEPFANGWVYSSWKDAGPFHVREQIPDSAFLQTGDFGWLDRNTSSMAAGDVTGDGREDILLLGPNRSEVSIWGDDQIDGWKKVASVPVDFVNAQDPQNPIISTVNLDTDSLVLSYSDAEHQLVFTEPLLIAALAAAPCQDGVGQNLEGCYTTFGTAETSSITTEQVLSVSAGVSVGVNIDGGALTQSEFEVKASVTVNASRSSASTYSLQKSVSYTTAPMEDSVIFTTVPYDQYTYTILSHPDPVMLGQTVVVSLPRDPITLITERTFYNDSVPEGSLQVGANVFDHTVGDIGTYPTRASKNAQLQNTGGLENGPNSVGQGGSATELGLAVGEEYSEGRSLELGFELEVEATAGSVLGGFSVGASRENSLTVTSGSETSYSGSIGSIDAANFSANMYSFGLFTYVFSDAATDQQFEVVNYWVER